jgi:hypothetical protein
MRQCRSLPLGRNRARSRSRARRPDGRRPGDRPWSPRAGARATRGVRRLVAALVVAHGDDVGEQHVVVGARVPRPRGGVAGGGVDEPGRRRGDRLFSPAPAPSQGELVQVGEGGVALGVHDGVHVLGSSDDTQLGHGLLRPDDELHARTQGVGQAHPAGGIDGSARAVEGVVGGIGDGALEAEGGCPRASPRQRRLTPARVVAASRLGVIVGEFDDGLAVIGDGVRSHHAHPRHRRSLPTSRCNRVRGVWVWVVTLMVDWREFALGDFQIVSVVDSSSGFGCRCWLVGGHLHNESMDVASSGRLELRSSAGPASSHVVS